MTNEVQFKRLHGACACTYGFWVLVMLLWMAGWYSGTVEVRVYRFDNEEQFRVENKTIEYAYSLLDGMYVAIGPQRTRVDISNPQPSWMLALDSVMILASSALFWAGISRESNVGWFAAVGVVAQLFIASWVRHMKIMQLDGSRFEFHLPYFIFSRDEGGIVPLGGTGYATIGNTVHEARLGLIAFMAGVTLLYLAFGFVLFYLRQRHEAIA